MIIKLDLRKGLWGIAIVFLAIGVIRVGGFFWITKSPDWQAIELAVQSDAQIKAEVKGKIVKVSPEFLGLSYGYNNYIWYARFTAEVWHETGMVRYQLHLTRSGQDWKVIEARKLR